MKILLIANDYWNFYNFRKELINKLLEDGYEIYLLAKKDQYINKFKNLDLNILDLNYSSRSISIFNDIVLIFKLFKIIKSINPNLILTFTIKANIYASFLSRFLKISTINNITGLGSSFLNNYFIKSITFFLYKISLSNSKYVLFQNQFDRDLFIKFKITNKDNSRLIPGSGIDIDFFRNNEEISKNKNIFLFCGRLLKDKGIIEYLQAAQIISNKYTNCEFHIVGKMNSKDKSFISSEILKKFLKNKNIKYFNFIENVKDAYEKSCCVILPSYREGLSKSLLEAASMSRPIITTNVPGCKDLVTNKINGFLVQSKNVDSLVEAINRFINLDHKEKALMGQKSRNLVENKFNVKILILIYLKLIKEIEYNLN